MKEKFNIVGKPVIRQDAFNKVTGQAKFADDYNYPNQLYAAMIRIPVSHAKIKSIDYTEAIESGLVAATCDSSDIPGAKKVGPIRKDQPVFCDEKVVTSGDVLAMLIGENEYELKQASKKVKVDFEELPILTDIEKAMDEDAQIIHPEFENNLIVHYPLRKGNIDKGFEESDHILEQTYTTPHIEHAYIEPEAVVAVPLEGNRGIKIIGSIQNPHTARKVVAAVLGLPLTKVRIIQAELGGSFGGKDDTMNILSARAAVAALKTKRPVKIHYSREESILESYKRHPYRLKYKVGFSKAGKLKAMKIDLLADGGGYSCMSPFVTWRSVVQATGPYEVENVWTDVRAVYTNNPYTGAFRGFGSPQPIFAQESLMDEIAEIAGISPIEIRKINGFQKGSVTASRQVLRDHEINLLKVVERAAEESNFLSEWNKNKKDQSNAPSFVDELNPIVKPEHFIHPSNNVKRGIGLATSFRGCSLGAEGVDAAAAYISVQTDGSIYLLSGLAENGQGLKTTFSIIAAEVLGISEDRIHYLEQDTGIIADSGPTVASRSTLMGGGAIKDAATIIKNRLNEVALKHFNITDYDVLVYRNNTISNTENNLKIEFSELCQLAFNSAVSLSAVGWYKGPNVGWDEETGQGDAYFTYVYGCQVADVSVDMSTGEVYINKIVAVHDPGTVINIMGALGQVYGGVTQGAGYGLWEAIESEKGMIKELNYDLYIIPTSKDIDKIEPIFIEGEDDHGAWGAKSLGEPTLELTSAALANAIKNATGKRLFNLPLNLEEVLLSKKLRPKDFVRESSK
ncbi:MAG: xanthine dehydrogenase family protein [Ignavibacteriae bacterium]|nr:xanthine dehydrogenase [Ignavibacteriota bacterium]NOG96458.1 xanthine dehydrogenase family protein [Ignavibacteriota bacterium]